MIASGLVDKRRLLEFFEEIEPQGYRFPAVNPPTFRASVVAFLPRQ
jgi:hypothetical protein